MLTLSKPKTCYFLLGSNKSKPPFAEILWLTERHATPLETFFFWCHHVTYRTPCHANGHLVIYSECCGFEGACFTLRCFFTLQSFMLFSRLPWGQQFNLIVSSASCWFSKHSNLQMGYRGRFYLCVSGLFRSKGSTNKELVTGFEPATLKVPCISSRLSWRSSHWVLWVLIDG